MKRFSKKSSILNACPQKWKKVKRTGLAVEKYYFFFSCNGEFKIMMNTVGFTAESRWRFSVGWTRASFHLSGKTLILPIFFFRTDVKEKFFFFCSPILNKKEVTWTVEITFGLWLKKNSKHLYVWLAIPSFIQKDNFING